MRVSYWRGGYTEFVSLHLPYNKNTPYAPSAGDLREKIASESLRLSLSRREGYHPQQNSPRGIQGKREFDIRA